LWSYQALLGHGFSRLQDIEGTSGVQGNHQWLVVYIGLWVYVLMCVHVIIPVVLLGTGGGQCRFCGSTNDTGLLAIGTVCAEKDCQERAKVVCTKTLPCSHPCNGVQGEDECLPCLHGCKTKQEGDKDEVKSKLQELKQDADDMCMICYTENLSCAPCIQVSVTHPSNAIITLSYL